MSDLFAQIPNTLEFDLIVANPPYIADAEWHTLDASVRDWEDKQALIAPHTGLAIIEAIIAQAHGWLRTPSPLDEHGVPRLIIEIGATQASKTEQLMQHAAGFAKTAVWRDSDGKERVIMGS